MGVFGAINTAVSGLRAQAFALENISGNIANSQTTGFKRQDTSFAELVSDTDSSQRLQNSGSVLASSRATNDIQGNIVGADQETFIAIQGDGYFAVRDSSGLNNGEPIFNGPELYTRAGDFQISNSGFLENGAGLFLSGFPINATGGAVDTLIAQPIQISTDPIAPVATSEINFRANLPIDPDTAASIDGDAASGLLDATLLAGATSGPATISNADETTFLNSSIAGGTTTVLDARGEAVNVEFRFAKTDSSDPAVGGDDTYNLYFRSNTDGVTEPAFTRVAQDYVFGPDGQLDPQIAPVVISGFSVDGLDIGDLTLDAGSSGFTQVATQSGVGTVSNTSISSNGSPLGSFSGVSISDSGNVSISYTNGANLDIARISIVTFDNDSGLERVDGGGTFAATVASGVPITDSSAGGTIIGSALEASNTDIADEFTKLIVTQQAYTANSRIITTGDEILSEAINLIR
ncbi:MAG: flagellar hook-basal body complex protein [Hyphomicrobiales bacterium]